MYLIDTYEVWQYSTTVKMLFGNIAGTVDLSCNNRVMAQCCEYQIFDVLAKFDLFPKHKGSALFWWYKLFEAHIVNIIR